MPHPAVAVIVAAADHPAQSGQRAPQRRARVGQPQVQVMVDGQRVEEFDIGYR